MRAIFPGRFQPFHLGHLHAIMEISKKNYDIIIVVENAGESFTKNDPLTAGERIEMIWETLRDIDLKNYIIVPMKNIENNAEWVNHLKAMLPEFHVCFSNNDLVKILMENAGITVKPIDFLNREKYQGRIIRETIAKNGEWKDLVPEKVYNFIKSRKIDERIKRLEEM